MKFRFMYSLAGEYRVVQETLADLEAITSNDYEVWLPNGISPQSSPASIRAAITSEFDAIAAKSIRASLRQFTDNSSTQLEQFFEPYLAAPSTVGVTLTRYGVGGYYEAPNRIIINLRATWDTPPAALLHELVHLAIEPTIVERLHLDHAAKEGLVDYLILHDPLLHRLIPNYHAQDRTTPPTTELISWVKSEIYFAKKRV